MEASQDVIELLEKLLRYMVVEGFMVCEQDPTSGLWQPSGVELSELYQDWVQDMNIQREEASRV